MVITFKSEFFRQRLSVVVSILFVVIVILGGVFLLLRNQEVSNQQEEEATPNENINTNLIEIKDLKSQNSNNNRVTLPLDWNFVIAFDNYPLSGYTCNDSSDCEIYSVSNERGHSFYVSSPTTISVESDGIKEDKTKLVTKYGELEFTALKARLFVPVLNQLGDVTDVQETESNKYVQIYGCIKDNICVSSGLLSNEDLVYEEQLNSFKSLVSELSIE